MIGVYNYLGGKNLCNIVANITVRKIEELFPNAETDISVINVGNFFIVRGLTSSDSVINVAQSVQDVLNNYDEKLSNSIRVIDTVTYNHNFKGSPIIVSLESNKKIKVFKDFINRLSKNNISLELKIDEKNKIIYFNQNGSDDNFVKNVINQDFKDYEVVEKKSNDVYISERFYGLSDCDEKYYHLLLKNISHHLFSLSISDLFDISINSTVPPDMINNENINIDLRSTKCIVKKEWLESLILDVFPFEIDKLKKYFDVDLEDEFNYLINDDYKPKWSNNKLANEIILL